MTISATFIDSNTFTISTASSAGFHEGRRVKANCDTDGYKYGTIETVTPSGAVLVIDLYTDSDDLTSNLVDVQYGIIGKGTDQSMPIHTHDGTEGSGGSLSLYYEEGSWTPVPADAASGGNTGSASTAIGRYVKIGNQITIWAKLQDINTGGLSAGQLFYIQGLPYANGSIVRAFGGMLCNFINFPSGDMYLPHIVENQQAVSFKIIIDNIGNDNLTVAGVNSGTADIWFTIIYFIGD